MSHDRPTRQNLGCERLEDRLNPTDLGSALPPPPFPAPDAPPPVSVAPTGGYTFSPPPVTPVATGMAGTYGVILRSAPWGEHGSSALEVSEGGLEVVGDEAGHNFAMVHAQNPLDAVRQALAGTLTVGANTYTLTPATLSDDPAAHAPFLLAAVPGGYEVRLEDLAGSPQASDWDYNDTVWAVEVTQYTETTPTPTPTVVVTPVADPDSPFLADPPKPPVTPENALIVVSKQAMTWITEGKVNSKVVTLKKANPGDPTVQVIEISLTGGHMDGVFKPVKIKVGAGTSAERDITLTLTGKVADPKADQEKEAFRVDYTGGVDDKFPDGAMQKDKDDFPLITTVRAMKKQDGKADVDLWKTAFPTKWTAAQIEVTVTAAVGSARKKSAPGTKWVPSKTDPNSGEFESTENDVKIFGKWTFDPKKGTLIVEEAYPRTK